MTDQEVAFSVLKAIFPDHTINKSGLFPNEHVLFTDQYSIVYFKLEDGEIAVWQDSPITAKRFSLADPSIIHRLQEHIALLRAKL